MAYELCNEKDHPAKIILELLIPTTKDNYPVPCAMFHKKGKHD